MKVLRCVAMLLCLMAAAARAEGAVPSDASSIDATLQRADALRSSNPDEFARLLGQLKASLASASPDQRDAIAYLDAYAMAYAGNYAQALVELKRLADTSDNDDIRFRAGALMVNSYAVTKQFTHGLRQLEATMALLPKIKDRDIRDHGLAVAALIYEKMGQHKISLRYASEMEAGASSSRAKCFAGQFKLDALQQLGQLPAEDALVVSVITLCQGASESTVVALARSNLARKWATEGRIDNAIELLQSSMAEAEATRYPPVVGELHALLAEYLLMKNDLSGAQQHARESVSQRADSGYAWYTVSAYKTLYEVAERSNDFATALRNYQQYADADRAYLTEVRTREMAYQIVRQEMDQKTQQIGLLDQQNKVLELQQKVAAKNADNNRLLILLLLLLVGTIGYWAYRVKRMQLSLRYMAQSDALTAISNRHHFSEQAILTLSKCAQAGEDVALIMFDLDHFKSINDRFGHDVGDWVLKRVADTCKGFCRRIDTLGRLGGEEFAILLTGCDLRGGNRVAEDCRVRIASIDTLPCGHKFVVTASFGVTATSLSGYDLAKLLSHADMMLYRAKRNGRNRVGTFDGVVPSTPFAAVLASAPGRVEEGATVYELTAHVSDSKQGSVP